MDYLLNQCYLQMLEVYLLVLNLIINGLPSKQITNELSASFDFIVLNLIINGLPSKLRPGLGNLKEAILGFKPYYKWITF